MNVFKGTSLTKRSRRDKSKKEIKLKFFLLILGLSSFLAQFSFDAVIASETFIQFEEKLVERNKVWKLDFNKPINRNTIKTNCVRVIDEKKEEVKVSLEFQEKAILVKPKESYTIGETYFLEISNIKSKDGKETIKPVKMRFKIKEPEAVGEFSFNGITIGDHEKKVIDLLGNPQRKDLNPYGFYWYVYNNNYNEFVMIGIEYKKVAAIYTNAVFQNKYGLKIGDSKTSVENKYGEGIKEINANKKKTHVKSYDTDIYKFDNYYVTIFYDTYDGNKISGVELVEKNRLEDLYSLGSYYGDINKNVVAAYEKEILDFTNVFRFKKGLQPLKWNNAASNIARSHSKDMQSNNYFEHDSLNGKSQFDRIKSYGIKYEYAGENISVGNKTGIFAFHSMWNNSEAREYMLFEGFERCGIGAIYSEEKPMCYTQIFYTPKK